MASGDLRAELDCSICLNIYTDPVTLICGHNFCRVCIDRVLDTQEGSGGYSCPECREKFPDRPALQKNMKLCNMEEKCLSVPPDQQGVFCTHCVDSPVPAVRSCLLCEVSLCDKHLRVHKKSQEHVLCDPTLSMESKKCSVHKKSLEYYCTEDNTCICVYCMIGGHKGHEMKSLDEASEKKKETLRNVLQKLLTKREETEERVQSLQEHRRKVEEEEAGDTERVTGLFEDIRRRLEDLEKRALRDISGRAERISISIRDLEIKKEELSRKLRHIEELCNVTDPLTVLQESDTGDLCDTEDGDNEDRERHEELLHDGGGLDVAGVLHTGLSDIITEVNVYFPKLGYADILLDGNTAGNNLQISDDRKTVSWSDIDQNRPETQEGSQDDPQVMSSQSFSSGLNYRDVDVGGSGSWRVGMCYSEEILLDGNTAHNNLHISDDGKTVSRSDRNQKRPQAPERFQWHPQVISRQSFSSGRHYWDVDVGGSHEWVVGMCYPSIDRKGHNSEIGENKKSWGLDRSGHQYFVMHDGNEIPLPDNLTSNRVRIDLDYEAGWISFYDLCDPIRHLHTFTTTFTEPLHAVFNVLKGCITICGGRCENSTPESGDIIGMGGATGSLISKGLEEVVTP
ncbi:E3 ubiquitin/ISG15 ligase TRIM25-like [Lithobates pipiens]